MFDDKYFRQLAGGLGHEWHRLATFLGFSRDAIDRMQEDYHRTEERIFQMLVSWRQNSDWRQGKVTQLKSALVKCNRHDLADQLEEMCLSDRFSHSLALSKLTESNPETDGELTGTMKQPGCCLDAETCCHCLSHTDSGDSLKTMRAKFQRRFAHLHGMERVGSTCRLVDFIAGYFDYYGGTLGLPEYDVLLYIPQGAIPSGKVQEVYLYVNPLVQSVPGLRSKTVLSPLVECGPSGLIFMKSIVLHLPHFAANGGVGWNIAAGVCYSESEETHSGDWNNLSPEENNNLIINKQQIILTLDHFSKYTVFGVPSSEECGKTVKACICPVRHPTAGYCKVRILIWNDTNITRQCVIRSQEALSFAALDDARCLPLTWGGGDLKLHLKNVRPGFKVRSTERCITQEKLWSDQMHIVTFDLQVDSSKHRGKSGKIEQIGDRLCDVEVCQSKKDWSTGFIQLPQCLSKVDESSSSDRSNHDEQREQSPAKTDDKSVKRKKHPTGSLTKARTSSIKPDHVSPHGRWKLALNFGNKGHVDTKTHLLRSIAAYKTGELVIADFGNDRVVISDSKGFVMDVIPLERVWDVAVLPNNYLVLVEESGNVKVFSEKREPAFHFTTVAAEKIGQRQVGLVSAAVGTNGNIFIGDAATNIITEHSPTDGAFLHVRQLTICPHFLAVNSKGQLLVSGWNGCRVDITNEQNAVVQTVHPSIDGKPAWCLGVCCDSKDDIFIVVTSSDDTVGHVHQYDAQGDFKECLVEGLHKPRGVVCVDDSKLAVANTDTVLLLERCDV